MPATGKITQVIGSTFDAEFPEDQLPSIYNAIKIDSQQDGKSMRLTSAVALAKGGAVDWRHVETADLQVRPLSEKFIAGYLDAEWPEVGYCVGVFRMEGRGVQLFSSIAGDHFTILGMPLLPLLGALRDRSLLPS